MSEIKSIPVPIVLKELIISNNQLLTNYQKELTAKVVSANIEIMQILGINAEDGWRLDMERMVYIKQTETSSE